MRIVATRYIHYGLLILIIVAAESVSAGDLTVIVLERAVDAPLANAVVQIGQEPGYPFPDNVATTGFDGVVSFSDPQLIDGLPLTVAAEGFAYLTVFDCPTGVLTVWCDRQTRIEWPDTSIISGIVENLPVSNNDDSLDLAVIFTATSLEGILTSEWELFSPFMDTMHVGFPVGDVPIPENIDIPSQTEYFILNFYKEPYHRRIKTGNTVDLLCLGYRVSLSDLLSGELGLVGTRAAVERDYDVSGDAVVDHFCATDFLNNVDVSVSNLPDGTQGIAVTVGELSSCPRASKYFPLNQAACPAGVATTVTLPILSAVPPFADVLGYAGVVFSDTSEGVTWGGGAFDWTPLGPWESRTFDSFYDAPEIVRTGAMFGYSGYQTPGTPAADFVLSRFTLEDQSGADSDTLAWETVAPGMWDSFVLPQLPSWAPGWGTLPDPGETPADDQLFWECYVVSAPVTLQEFIQSPLRSGQLFSFRRASAPPLTGPGNVTIQAITQTDLELIWDPEPMAETYIIHWMDTPWGVVVGQDETDLTIFVDSNALPSPNSQRYYRIVSHAGASLSPPSDLVGGASWELDDGE